MAFEVQELVLPDGRMPFSEWLESLGGGKKQMIVDARIARFRAGNLGDHKSVGEGVFELRIDYGPGLRVYFGRRGQTVFILLGGGEKKTQARDIRRAQQLWKQHEDDHR